MTPLTTKAAEIRAGLVADWRKAMEGVTPGEWQKGTKRTLGYVCESDDQSDGMLIPIADVYGENPDADLAWIARCSPAGIASLLALIEQQAAELAQARAEALPAGVGVERIVEAMEDEPFWQDAGLAGTTQQDQRIRHYAEVAVRALSSAPAQEGRS